MSPTMKTIWESVVSFRRQHLEEPQIILLDRGTFYELLDDCDRGTALELTNSPTPTLFGCELFLACRPRKAGEKIVIVK